MKNFIQILFLIACQQLAAQQIPLTTEQQLELVAASTDGDKDDDAMLQLLEQVGRNKVNVNSAEMQLLVQLGIITSIQLDYLRKYREHFGDLLSIYELQAVPGWHPVLLRKLKPYVVIASPAITRAGLSERLKQGEHSVIIRYATALRRSSEFLADQNGHKKYLGGPGRVFLRYRYVFKNLIQYGITADKDAGEQFFKGAFRRGFDFYSAHLFLRQMGTVSIVAIGDYSVNMGQGLIQWQSMAFKKTADAMNVKRQSDVLRPYNSAGEFNFFRGVGVGLDKGAFHLTLFASRRKISTNQDHDETGLYFSSILRSGYNRTASELADRNNTVQLSTGAVARYNSKAVKIGVNAIATRFSLPFNKQPAPYNLYAMRGSNWINASLDYTCTWKNLHWFGELAVDAKGRPAALSGFLASLHKLADLTVAFRSFHAAYQTLGGNAFSENTYPGNETGLYVGLGFRPSGSWKLDLFTDSYRFPWLKYRVNAPSYGRDWMIQLVWTPDKQVEIHTRLRKNGGETNSTSTDSRIAHPLIIPSLNWRTQINFKLNRFVTLRNRIDYVSVNNQQSNGFLSAFDVLYNPMQKPYSLTTRIQFYETDDYGSRLYAYENDVLYSQSVPAFAGSGFRYYVVLNWEPCRFLSLWIRYSVNHTFREAAPDDENEDQTSIAASELKFQARFLF